MTERAARTERIVAALAEATRATHGRMYVDEHDTLPGAANLVARAEEDAAIAHALDHLHPAVDTRALDVGCGYGRLIPALRERAAFVAAFDPDHRRLARARPLAGRDVALFRLTIEEVPWDALAGAFDIVLCAHALGHLPRATASAVLPLLARALAPGGAIVVALPVTREPRDLFFATSRDGFDHAVDAASFDDIAVSTPGDAVLASRHFARASLDALAAAAGLAVRDFVEVARVDARRANAVAVLTPSPARAFVKNVEDVHGARGRAFLDELPARVAACAQRWGLAVGAPFDALSYHWVAPCSRGDEAAAVLKLGVPNDELTQEIAALRVWDGAGAARLLEADVAAGALVLERLVPGTSLASAARTMGEPSAAAIVAGLAAQLHVPAPAGTRDLEDWTRGLVRARDEAFAPDLVARALAVRARLLASTAPARALTLLHGDLHGGNVLAASRAPWLAIDPKGIAGDPAYEPASFLVNVRDSRDLAACVDAFAARLDRARVLAWAFVHAVLSAWWTVEDHGAVDSATLQRARALEALA